MTVQTVFISINAGDFAAQTAWWARLLGRGHDRKPMPGCHEWDLTDSALFQVLDSPGKPQTDVALRFDRLAPVVERLRAGGIAVPETVDVDGFADLRLISMTDPEGNRLSLLQGG